MVEVESGQARLKHRLPESALPGPYTAIPSLREASRVRARDGTSPASPCQSCDVHAEEAPLCWLCLDITRVEGHFGGNLNLYRLFGTQ